MSFWRISTNHHFSLFSFAPPTRQWVQLTTVCIFRIHLKHSTNLLTKYYLLQYQNKLVDELGINPKSSDRQAWWLRGGENRNLFSLSCFIKIFVFPLEIKKPLGASLNRVRPMAHTGTDTWMICSKDSSSLWTSPFGLVTHTEMRPVDHFWLIRRFVVSQWH